MKFTKALSAAVLAGVFAAPALAGETIEVAYPYSALFDVTFERIMPMFNKQHPDITVKFRATYDNYEDATQTLLQLKNWAYRSSRRQRSKRSSWKNRALGWWPKGRSIATRESLKVSWRIKSL